MDQRQVANYCCILWHKAGEFLPPQLIYHQGKTTACLPRHKLPSDWHVTFIPNHWSNEKKGDGVHKKYHHSIRAAKATRSQAPTRASSLSTVWCLQRPKTKERLLLFLKITTSLWCLYPLTALTASSRWISASTRQQMSSCSADSGSGMPQKYKSSWKTEQHRYHLSTSECSPWSHLEFDSL